MLFTEEIVMTPAKRDNVTHIQIEKVKKNAVDEAQVAHKAGGQHSGLVINKQAEGRCCTWKTFIPTVKISTI